MLMDSTSASDELTGLSPMIQSEDVGDKTVVHIAAGKIFDAAQVN